MERRKAFATAGAVSMTALAAVVALGANVGLFGLARHDGGPGQFKLVDNTQQGAKPSVRTEVVDVPVPVPSGPPAAGTSVAPPATAASRGSHESDDDHGSDDGYESESGDDEDD